MPGHCFVKSCSHIYIVSYTSSRIAYERSIVQIVNVNMLYSYLIGIKHWIVYTYFFFFFTISLISLYAQKRNP